MEHTKRYPRAVPYHTVQYFFKQMVTIFLDFDPLVRYCMVLSCTFTVFFCYNPLQTYHIVLYSAAPYLAEDYD